MSNAGRRVAIAAQEYGLLNSAAALSLRQGNSVGIVHARDCLGNPDCWLRRRTPAASQAFVSPYSLRTQESFKVRWCGPAVGRETRSRITRSVWRNRLFGTEAGTTLALP